MFRKQITIALACAGLICASTTVSTGNTAKQNATGPQTVLVARSGQQGGSTPGKPRGGKPSSPKSPKPVATA